MRSVDPHSAAAFGRRVLLALLFGHLLFRRQFAHLNLGDLLSGLGISAPAILSKAFVTELCLLILSVPAVVVAQELLHKHRGPSPDENALNPRNQFAFAATFVFLLWGAGHVAYAIFSGRTDVYLIVRQSALAFYALIFVYTYLFFGDATSYTRSAMGFAVASALLCAITDHFGWPGLVNVPGTPDPEPMYGQQTLALAMLGFTMVFVAAPGCLTQFFALGCLVFCIWRQLARPLQSVVPVSLAAALGLYLLLGVCVAIRAHRETLQRAALCCVVLGASIFLARSYKKQISDAAHVERTALAAEAPVIVEKAPSEIEARQEVKAWSLQQYRDLFAVYERTKLPESRDNYMISRRPPFVPVTDEEVYKLEEVYTSAPNLSVRNNIWRLLVWRRMALDVQNHPVVGAGVGKAWFYTGLYSSQFHYGEEREGLDPHNSYLNLIYRYGAIGFLIFLSILISVLVHVWRALKVKPGDPLLEGFCLYFFYTLAFAFFTVSLEGPSYSLPFWMSLGLCYARARQILNHREKEEAAAAQTAFRVSGDEAQFV